jgi:hypothetical protein
LLLTVICKCGHVGAVSAQTLPRDLRCWRCGTTRHVEARHGRRIVNKIAVIEWLAGAEAPRARARIARPSDPA